MSKDVLIKGKNDFPFSYQHQIDSLEKEFESLQEILKNNGEEAILQSNANSAVIAGLENKIRSICTIMVDLTYYDNRNKRQDSKENIQKVIAENESFIMNNHSFAPLFKSLANYRKALCHHLDTQKILPYHGNGEMLEFAKDLGNVYEANYIANINKAIEVKPVEKPLQQHLANLKNPLPSYVQIAKKLGSSEIQTTSSQEIQRDASSRNYITTEIKKISNLEKPAQVNPLGLLMSYDDEDDTDSSKPQHIVDETKSNDKDDDNQTKFKK